MVKRVSTRRIRKNRHYTYDSAGTALGLSPATVRSWRVAGLNVMASCKPHYILGEALIEFVEQRQPKRAGSMPLDKMYCFSCRARTTPLGGMVDYVATTDMTGRLVGLCERCEHPVHRFVSVADLADFHDIYDVAIKPRSQA